MQRSRLLVTDSAAQTPRQSSGSLNFTLGRNMKSTLKISLGILGIFTILALLSGTVAWDGESNTIISFELRDDETNRPIEGALIFAGLSGFDSFQRIKPETKEAYLNSAPYIGRTDRQGVASISFSARAGGGRFLFFRTGRYHVEEHIIIKAEGYEDVIALAQNLLGQKTFSIFDQNHSTSVYLRKKNNEPNK